MIIYVYLDYEMRRICAVDKQLILLIYAFGYFVLSNCFFAIQYVSSLCLITKGCPKLQRGGKEFPSIHSIVNVKSVIYLPQYQHIVTYYFYYSYYYHRGTRYLF